MTVRAHGTRSCYVHGPTGIADGEGCRCDPCRAANAAAVAERKRRTTPPYVDAQPVREHLAWLSAHGVGLKTVGTRAGVSHGALWKIVYGAPGRGPNRRVRPATRDAILAVRPADAAPGALVHAAVTWEAIYTLLGRGWTKAAIARAIGQHGPGLQVGRKRVQHRTAQAITALLDEPVPETRGTTRAKVDLRRDLTRTRAQRHRDRGRAEAHLGDDYGPPATDDDLNLPTLDVALDLPGAPCRRPDVPTWLFFPDPRDTETIDAAKAICATCRHAATCTDYAIQHQEHGVWGGTTDEERTGIVRLRALIREAA